MARQTSKRTVRKARALRRDMSLPEVLLWQRLKGCDVKIRRQHPCGPYVLDFYCAEAALAIEIDGISHGMGDRPMRDEGRDAFLTGRRIEVIRIPAKDVLADVDGMADAIVAECRRRRA